MHSNYKIGLKPKRMVSITGPQLYELSQAVKETRCLNRKYRHYGPTQIPLLRKILKIPSKSQFVK